MKTGAVRVGVLVTDLLGIQTVNYERGGSRWLGQMHLSGDLRLRANEGDRVRLEWTGSVWKCEVLGRDWTP